jgi:Xaa-Pro aminopeptidase
MDHAGRVRRLRAALAEHHLDALIVSHLPNVRYLSGFTGSSAALLVTEGRALLLTDGRYRAQAREEVKAAKTVIVGKAPVLAAGEWLAENRKAFPRGPVAVGVEGEHLTVASQKRIKAELSATFRLKMAPPLIESARMMKDRTEIELIRAAIEVGAGLFDTALETIRPGATEIEVAAAMEFEARRRGAEGMSFETIIASGARSALPHGRASRQEIPRDGFVVCDFGVILRGYCSDRTRTVYVGSASSGARAFYGAVLDAQQAGIAAVRAGATCDEVDGEARKVLQKNKLARYFTHSTGHGVGLEIHEGPRVAGGQTQVLEPGMVITIEPGAYIPGQWGVRIEDVVVVTATGCEVLTPSQKEFIEV